METMETTAAQAIFTPEEYLARERKTLTKSEYRISRFIGCVSTHLNKM